MAKTKTRTKPKKLKPIPPIRAWEVRLGDDSIETVVAHDCSTYNDALTFTRIEGEDDGGDRDWVTVRAFCDSAWKTVRLVEEHEPPAPEVP